VRFAAWIAGDPGDRQRVALRQRAQRRVVAGHADPAPATALRRETASPRRRPCAPRPSPRRRATARSSSLCCQILATAVPDHARIVAPSCGQATGRRSALGRARASSRSAQRRGRARAPRPRIASSTGGASSGTGERARRARRPGRDVERIDADRPTRRSRRMRPPVRERTRTPSRCVDERRLLRDEVEPSITGFTSRHVVLRVRGDGREEVVAHVEPDRLPARRGEARR
jgi:hypothetical protein